MDIAAHTEEQEYQLMMDNLLMRSKLENFSLEEIENELHHLLIYQGHGWGGRSETKEAEIQGQVYAYQIFLKRYHDGPLETDS